MDKYLKVDRKYFCKGQTVRIVRFGELSWKKGIVNCVQPLSEFYQLTGLIPVTQIPEVGAYNILPKYLKILDKKKKGGVTRMPRITKIALYSILVLTLWRLAYPLADILLKFLSRVAGQ